MNEKNQNKSDKEKIVKDYKTIDVGAFGKIPFVETNLSKDLLFKSLQTPYDELSEDEKIALRQFRKEVQDKEES